MTATNMCLNFVCDNVQKCLPFLTPLLAIASLIIEKLASVKTLTKYNVIVNRGTASKK